MTQLDWMVGQWSGTIHEDQVTETWTPAVNGTMVGTFRWERNGKPRLYELILIDLTVVPPLMKLRHFGGDFQAWEERDAPAIFALETCTAEGAQWRELGTKLPSSLHYRRDGDQLSVWFEREGAPPPVSGTFQFRRV